MEEMKVSLKQVEKNSVDIEKLSNELTETLNNIGSFGVSNDLSQNQLKNPVQDKFPLVDWLMNTELSSVMRNTRTSGNAVIYEDGGETVIKVPDLIHTELPADASGACCWLAPDLAKCSSNAPLRLLCLKDCTDMMTSLIDKNLQRVKATDSVSYFMQKGETIEEARKRLDRLAMAFYTARNMVLGTMDTETGTLKRFHGLLEIMEDSAVSSADGTNILAAFDTIGCRLSVLNDGKYKFAVHPLTYQAVQKEVKKGRNGNYPDGWEKDMSGNITYMGFGFIQDKTVPVDLDTNTGEIWVLDGAVLGAYLMTTLQPQENFIFTDAEHNNVPADGCAENCVYMYNVGTVFATNYNHLMMIQNVPLNTACAGDTLKGLDGLIQPETIVPR